MPAPGADLQTISPLIGITITDDTAAVANGQPPHYRVTIHNPVTFRVTFSAATTSPRTHSIAGGPALTDLNTITAPRERGLAWLASIALGLLAVAGSIWLHRKVTPELLTPANASHGHAVPEQP
jgi:hypothetical protein